jgi:hypothetical protein
MKNNNFHVYLHFDFSFSLLKTENKMLALYINTCFNIYVHVGFPKP